MTKKPNEAANMKVNKTSMIEPSAPHKIQGVASAVEINTVAPISVGLGRFFVEEKRFFRSNAITPIVNSNAAESNNDVWFCAVKKSSFAGPDKRTKPDAIAHNRSTRRIRGVLIVK